MKASIDDPEFECQLAFRWAPVHYQDVDQTGSQSLGGKSDYLTAVDYDGDWVTTNNWENLPHFPASAVVYYSITESETHWFIIYAFYHPRDWKNDIEFETAHENDMEGCLLVVEKPAGANAERFGVVRGMVAVAHLDFYSYVPEDSPWTDGPPHAWWRPGENIDGVLRFETFDGLDHPVTYQEARGHALRADVRDPFGGGDGIRYLPSLTLSEEPKHPNDRNVHYQLVDIFGETGLWSKRGDPNVFAKFGVFRGDTHGVNSANAPWKWDDKDDGGRLQGGELAVDPIKLIKIYFTGLGIFSEVYLSNRYQSII